MAKCSAVHLNSWMLPGFCASVSRARSVRGSTRSRTFAFLPAHPGGCSGVEVGDDGQWPCIDATSSAISKLRPPVHVHVHVHVHLPSRQDAQPPVPWRHTVEGADHAPTGNACVSQHCPSTPRCPVIRAGKPPLVISFVKPEARRARGRVPFVVCLPWQCALVVRPSSESKAKEHPT